MTEQKDDPETAELQKYIEGILKPTNEDIDLAIQLVCSSSDRHKFNGFKSVHIEINIVGFHFEIITFSLH